MSSHKTSVSPPKIKLLTSFSKEITFALFIKFMLLGLIWWLFFSSQKPVISGSSVTNQLFGVAKPTHTAKTGAINND